MPTVFTHGVVALGLGKTAFPKEKSSRFWLASIACSLAADLDVLAFVVGIEYRHPFGHRGFGHSLLFALLFALAVTTWFVLSEKKESPLVRFKYGVYFVLLAASHGVLDALTDGGLGIGFFVPFENSRYFLPYRPIQVSPIGLAFFSPYGLAVLLNEILWIWLPVLFITAGIAAYRYYQLERTPR